jgi:hypothetical protein
MPKTVYLELDGQKRAITYNMNALIAIKDKTGKPLEQVASLADTYEGMRTLLWAGLLSEEPSITEWDAGKLFGLDNMMEVLTAITDALGGALGKAKAVTSDPQGAVGEHPKQ